MKMVGHLLTAMFSSDNISSKARERYAHCIKSKSWASQCPWKICRNNEFKGKEQVLNLNNPYPPSLPEVNPRAMSSEIGTIELVLCILLAEVAAYPANLTDYI
jgi:hypothetical protein